jgi:hypothetical protein
MGLKNYTHRTTVIRGAAVLGAVGMLFILFSCNNLNQSIPGADEEKDPKGVLSISIPAYTPGLEDILSGSPSFSTGAGSLNGTEPRAFAVAGRVELAVYDSASGLAAEKVFTPGSFAAEGLSLEMPVPPGPATPSG